MRGVDDAGEVRARPAAPTDGGGPVRLLPLEVTIGGGPNAEVGDGRELLPIERGRRVGQLPVREETETPFDAVRPVHDCRQVCGRGGRGIHGRCVDRARRVSAPRSGRGPPGRRAWLGIRRPAPRIDLPVRRPAGSVSGSSPSTAPAIGRPGASNATLTRAPAANGIWSSAWAMASSYWIEDGRLATRRPTSVTGTFTRVRKRPATKPAARAPTIRWDRRVGRRGISDTAFLIGVARVLDSRKRPRLGLPADGPSEAWYGGSGAV